MVMNEIIKFYNNLTDVNHLYYDIYSINHPYLLFRSKTTQISLPFIFLEHVKSYKNHETTRLDKNINSRLIKAIYYALHSQEIFLKSTKKFILNEDGEFKYITLKVSNVKIISNLAKLYSNFENFYLNIQYDILMFKLPNVSEVLAGKVVSINTSFIDENNKFYNCNILENSLPAIVLLNIANNSEDNPAPKRFKGKVPKLEAIKINDIISFKITKIDYDTITNEFFVIHGLMVAILYP